MVSLCSGNRVYASSSTGTLAMFDSTNTKDYPQLKLLGTYMMIYHNMLVMLFVEQIKVLLREINVV